MPDRPPNAARIPVAVIAGLFLATLALRPQILAVGPLLPLIRADLDLPASLAGLLTTIPVLCMGIFAPLGPRLAARLGPRSAFAVCLGLIVGFGAVRAVAPAFPLILLATLGIGVGIGIAGAIPSMVVSQQVPDRPALGTGAYAGGIVAGSTIAAAVAVPLAVGGDWRLSLALLSAGSLVSIGAWLVLVRGAGDFASLDRRPRVLPWRSATGWLLVLLFGLQSILYYGIAAWLPNAFVERGWSAAEAGSLVAILNAIGLTTTIGVPLLADRFGSRRSQLVTTTTVATVGLVGLVMVPTLAYVWIVAVGIGLGVVFPLVMTLPLDVTDDPGQVGSVAALMLFGGYILASIGPLMLGAARDLTGDFQTSLWLLVGVSVVLVVCCAWLSPARLHRGIRRAAAHEA
jgi:CP family cyanate transporter-like MFS transporter